MSVFFCFVVNNLPVSGLEPWQDERNDQTSGGLDKRGRSGWSMVLWFFGGAWLVAWFSLALPFFPLRRREQSPQKYRKKLTKELIRNHQTATNTSVLRFAIYHFKAQAAESTTAPSLKAPWV